MSAGDRFPREHTPTGVRPLAGLSHWSELIATLRTSADRARAIATLSGDRRQRRVAEGCESLLAAAIETEIEARHGG